MVDSIGQDGTLVVVDPLKPQKDGRKAFRFDRVFGPAATQGNAASSSTNLKFSLIFFRFSPYPNYFSFFFFLR